MNLASPVQPRTAGSGHAASAADDLFVELVCADDEWVRAEFAALIDAVWTDPPPREPVQHPASTPPPSLRREPRTVAPHPQERADQREGRQRSPPG